VVSACATKSPQLFAIDESQLGGVPTDKEQVKTQDKDYSSISSFSSREDPLFRDLCGSLRSLMKDLRDETWNALEFALGPRLPWDFPQEMKLSEKKPNGWRPMFLEAHALGKSKGSADSWIHLPANNEKWMAVGGPTILLLLLKLTGYTRTQYKRSRP
jgi:hypothetical protein